MSGWQPIETAPAVQAGLFQVVVARIRQPLDEDNAPNGPPEIYWAHTAYRSGAQWMSNTAGLAGLHGNASFPIGQPTHWMPLPAAEGALSC